MALNTVNPIHPIIIATITTIMVTPSVIGNLSDLRSDIAATLN